MLMITSNATSNANKWLVMLVIIGDASLSVNSPVVLRREHINSASVLCCCDRTRVFF